VQHDLAVQFFRSNARQFGGHSLNLCIRSGYQDYLRGYNTPGNHGVGAAGANVAQSLPSSRLGPRHHGTDFPAQLAQTAP
jgi:hypothetical protein